MLLKGLSDSPHDYTGYANKSLVINAAETAFEFSTTDVVTQATSKTTGVTLDTHSGVITTVALTDAADTSFTFTLTSAKILAGSIIQLTPVNAGNGIVNLSIVSITAGSAVIRVANVGTAALNSLIKIHFRIS